LTSRWLQPTTENRRNTMTRTQGLFGVVLALALLFVSMVPSSLPAQNRRFDEFTQTKPMAGEIAPDFTLETLEGAEFSLSAAYAVRPVVIEFGSYT